jgi:hypothetical protein
MKKKPSNIYLDIILNPYVKKVSYLILLILFLIICLKSCHIQKVSINNKQINKELLEKQKYYQDSIKNLNKKLEKLGVKKDGVIIDYKTKVEYITKYKIRLKKSKKRRRRLNFPQNIYDYSNYTTYTSIPVLLVNNMVPTNINNIV